MKINADMRLRASAMIDDLAWQWSPDGSVERRMLDRDGGKVARATGVVRYPSGSRVYLKTGHLAGGLADLAGQLPPGTASIWRSLRRWVNR